MNAEIKAKRQLVIIEGPDLGRIIQIVDAQALLIGRGQGSDVRLSDLRVSRTHCRIQVRSGSALLNDTGSTAGTFVNGESIEQCELMPGDIVTIGDTRLRYQLERGSTQIAQVATVFGRPKPRPAVTPLEDLVGHSLSDFHLEAIIAKGVSGMVYCARDAKNDRAVAVKVLSLEYAGTVEQKERFVRGIKAMAPIRNDNVVALYTAGIQGPYCWMAMEYVDGESLAEVIERVGASDPRDWRDAYRVAVHIGRALAAAGRHKIIHRNVTPQNILVRAKDQVAKLGDLSLAKALEGTLSRQVTRPGELVGDVAYMSPERTRGQQHVDGRSDIYGLGATLYALTTGRPPFAAASLPELITKIRNEDPIPPTSDAQKLPQEFQELVLRMIAKRPADRYQTPDQLLDELQRCGRSLGITI